MAKFEKKELEHLSKLCRIHCSEEELEQLARDLEKIVSYVDQLQEVDTSHLEPHAYLQEQRLGALREDVVGPCLSRALFLKNSPDQVGGMIRVPPVIKNPT